MATTLAAKGSNTGAKERNNGDRRGSKREWHRPKLARPLNKLGGKEKPSQNSEMGGQLVRTIKSPRNKRFDSNTSAKHRTRAHKAEAKNKLRTQTVTAIAQPKKSQWQNKTREKTKGPTLLSTTSKHHWELREKKVHQPKVQRNTSYVDKTTKVLGAKLEQLDRKTQGQGERETLKKEGPEETGPTHPKPKPRQVPKEGTQSRQTDHRDKEQQEDKVTKSHRLHPKVALQWWSFSGAHKRLQPTTLHRPSRRRKSSRSRRCPKTT